MRGLPTRQLNSDFGLEWSDYGARFYDAASGRFPTVDPLSEKYTNLSTYVYVANNPMLYIDPDGMTIEDPDGIVKSQKERLNDNIAAVNEVLKMIGDNPSAKSFKDYKAAMNTQLDQIGTLEKSDQVYNVSYEGDSSNGGGTSYNEKNGSINISIGKGKTELEESGVVSHELAHGYQYEKGQISLKVKNDGYGALYDITDEVGAYNNQSVLEHGKFFQDHEWTDSSVKQFGKEKMTPQAYQNLPSGPININSKEGKELRKTTKQAGAAGTPVGEVYKGWERDYEKGKKGK